MEYVTTEQCDTHWKQLLLVDRTAKAKACILGRYLQEGHADGYAIYQIIKVSKHTVRIRFVKGIGDDWVLPYWGVETSIPKQYALDNIKYRDTLSELFTKKKGA